MTDTHDDGTDAVAERVAAEQRDDGGRLHETSGDDACSCVRNAIAVAMQEDHRQREVGQ